MDAMLSRKSEIEQGDYIDIATKLGRPWAELKAFRGDVWGVVAPSGGGKTAWMIQLVAEMAAEQSYNTLYISPEVSDFILHRRAIQMLGKVSAQEVYVDPESYFTEYEHVLQHIRVLPSPENHNTLERRLLDVAVELKDEIDMIVIDHMKLMNWEGEFRTEIERFCGFIKDFAVRNKLIVWLVNQVPKSAVSDYGGVKKDLEITDVSEASGIYQILDGGIVINTPYGNQVSARKIKVGKARDGEAGKLQDCWFRQHPKFFRFEQATHDELRKEMLNIQKANDSAAKAKPKRIKTNQPVSFEKEDITYIDNDETVVVDVDF